MVAGVKRDFTSVGFTYYAAAPYISAVFCGLRAPAVRKQRAFFPEIEGVSAVLATQGAMRTCAIAAHRVENATLKRLIRGN